MQRFTALFEKNVAVKALSYIRFLDDVIVAVKTTRETMRAMVGNL